MRPGVPVSGAEIFLPRAPLSLPPRCKQNDYVYFEPVPEELPGLPPPKALAKIDVLALGSDPRWSSFLQGIWRFFNFGHVWWRRVCGLVVVDVVLFWLARANPFSFLPPPFLVVLIRGWTGYRHCWRQQQRRGGRLWQ